MSLTDPKHLIISQTDGRPMYLQIVDQIRQRVAIGDWPHGAELPSIRQLAVALRVSVITVKRAYYELEREGVIVTQQGKGSIVAAAPVQASRLHADELRRHVDEVARLGALLGLSDEDLSELIRNASAAGNGERKASK